MQINQHFYNTTKTELTGHMLKILAIGCIALCCVVIGYVVMIYMESRNYKQPRKPY